MGEFSGTRRNSNITLMQSKTFKKNMEHSFSCEVISQCTADLKHELLDEDESGEASKDSLNSSINCLNDDD